MYALHLRRALYAPVYLQLCPLFELKGIQTFFFSLFEQKSWNRSVWTYFLFRSLRLSAASRRAPSLDSMTGRKWRVLIWSASWINLVWIRRGCASREPQVPTTTSRSRRSDTSSFGPSPTGLRTEPTSRRMILFLKRFDRLISEIGNWPSLQSLNQNPVLEVERGCFFGPSLIWTFQVEHMAKSNWRLVAIKPGL